MANSHFLCCILSLGLGFGFPIGVSAGPQPPIDLLKINEVRLGGAGPFFVEMFNAGAASVSMIGVSLETSQGTFDLSSVPSVASGAHILIVRSSTAGAGLLLQGAGLAVDVPIAHVIRDTLLLKKSGAMLDAVSYGVTRDTSLRYTAAVQAGQLSNGSFVKTGTSYQCVSIGRNISGADTNRSSDWALHGGADSYNASPGRGNAEVLSGEKNIVRMHQTLLNQVFGNVLDMRVTYATHQPMTSATNCVQSLVVDSPDFGVHTLSGDTVSTFMGLGAGDYDFVFEGNLSDNALALQYSIKETVRTASTGRLLECTLTNNITGNQYKYAENLSTLYSGFWGNFTATHTRSTMGWDAVPRVTASTQKVSWAAGQAEVISVNTTFSMTRDFPPSPPKFAAFDAWVAGGGVGNPPNFPYVAEKIDATAVVAGSPGNLSVSFTSFHIDHGTFGQGNYNNFTFTSQKTTPNQWTNNIHFDFAGPTTATINVASTSTIDPLTEDLSTTGTISSNGTTVGSFDYYVDPVRNNAVAGGFWEWALWTVNTAVTGAICGVGTAVACGTTIVVGTVTIGAGVPLGVAGIAATAGGCAVATGFVCNSLWPQ